MQTTSQINVQFPKGTPVCQVDDFPPKTPRSREGAVHIRPNSTTSITQQEADHIKSKGIRFTKLGKTAPPPVPAQGDVAAAPPSAPEPTPAPAPEPEPASARAKPLVRRRDTEAPTE